MNLANTPTTQAAFAAACVNLNSIGIYELFESISQELRDEIYTLAEEPYNEPCRDAMIKLGDKYNINSLKNY